jgi:hypothetical protein
MDLTLQIKEPTNIGIYWPYKTGGNFNKMKVKSFQHVVTDLNLLVCYEQKMVKKYHNNRKSLKHFQ